MRSVSRLTLFAAPRPAPGRGRFGRQCQAPPAGTGSCQQADNRVTQDGAGAPSAQATRRVCWEDSPPWSLQPCRAMPGPGARPGRGRDRYDRTAAGRESGGHQHYGSDHEPRSDPYQPSERPRAGRCPCPSSPPCRWQPRSQRRLRRRAASRPHRPPSPAVRVPPLRSRRPACASRQPGRARCRTAWSWEALKRLLAAERSRGVPAAGAGSPRSVSPSNVPTCPP